ncbi:MAG: type II secretion system F family protein [Selenomonadaceae bacterium]|nr:type II secretion system F family protein [Selenomonadaceae bacterium]
MIILFSLVVALAFFGLVILLSIFLQKRKNKDIVRKLRRYGVRPVSRTEGDVNILIKQIYQFVQKVAKPLVDRNIAQSLEYKLQQAGLSLLGGEYIVISISASLITGIIIWFLTLSFMIAFAAAVGVSLVLWFIVLILIQRRLESFTEQLGDCLITIANALRAGYSFQQAVEIIANEMEPPISDEFARMTHDIVMGMPLEEALENANHRVGSPDFELVVTAVLIQHEVGGNLAQILDSISYTIAERIRMKREISALTAQGRFSAIVLLLLPFAAGSAMYVVNHDDFVQMLHDPMGQMAMLVSFILEIIGYFVIRRIVDIDV